MTEEDRSQSSPRGSGPQEAELHKFYAAFEQSRDGILFQDRTRFLDANLAALSLFRASSIEALLACHPSDLFPAFLPSGQPSQETAQARIEEAYREGQAFFEWRSRTLEGKEFPSEVLLNRIDLPGGPVLEAVVRDITERKQVEARLQKREAELQEAQSVGKVGNWVWDLASGTTSWSDELFRLLGLSPRSLSPSYTAFLEFVHPEDRDDVDQKVRQALAGETEYDCEHRILDPDGQERVVHGRASVEWDDSGQAVRMLGTLQDITPRKEAERVLRQRADKVAMVQAISTKLIGARFEAMDPVIEEALARIGAAAEADQCQLFRLLEAGQVLSKTHEWYAAGRAPSAPIEEFQGTPAAHYPWLMDQLSANEVVQIGTLEEIPDPDFRGVLAGEGIWSILFVPLWLEDAPAGFLGLATVGREGGWSASDRYLLRLAADTLSSALSRWDLEAELRYKAYHDPLTGLANRMALHEILARELARYQRYGPPFSLLMFDLDHFKSVNDRYGHETGDTVLKQVARLAQETLRAPDVVGRWGGEEFLGLLPEVDAGEAQAAAERLRQRIAEAPFQGPDQVTISLGVATLSEGENPDQLLRRVDDALYRAKEGGRNRVEQARLDPS